jgi:hypothetical protein
VMLILQKVPFDSGKSGFKLLLLILVKFKHLVALAFNSETLELKHCRHAEATII